MEQVNYQGYGYLKCADVITAKTLAITDVGVVQNVQDTLTITLPATVVGYYYRFYIGADDITLTLAPNSVDRIAGNGFTATDNKVVTLTSQPAGSFIELLGDGVNGWFVTAVNGIAVEAS